MDGNKPVTRHMLTFVRTEEGLQPVRIMLLKYDGNIEVYYQEEGYAYEFSFGVSGIEGFRSAMDMAVRNAEWGLHNE